MRKVVSVVRWRWNDRTGPARLDRELRTAGIARIVMPDAAAQTSAPQALFGRLFGERRHLYRSSRIEVRPRAGHREIVSASGEGPPHIDDDEFLPSQVQILCCVRQARRGGESYYIDSWKLLHRIEKREPDLFRALFEVPRLYRYSGARPFRPTFCMRYGSLICSHAPMPEPGDEIGARFQQYVNAAPRYQFLAEPGDICIVHQQRMMHGRTAFTGARKFIRLLCWFTPGLPNPPRLQLLAERFARKVAARNQRGPAWVREWLSPSRASTEAIPLVAAVLAYIRGESAEDVCTRFGLEPVDLYAQTARVLSVAAAALGDAQASGAIGRASLAAHANRVMGSLRRNRR